MIHACVTDDAMDMYGNLVRDLEDSIKRHAIDGSPTHGSIDVADKVLAIASEVLGSLCYTRWISILIRQARKKRTLVERIICVGFEEEVLQADHHRVEIEHGLPILS